MGRTMAETTTLTIELPKETDDRLATLAKSTGRSKSELVGDAIEAFVQVEAWQIQGIEDALRQADAGEIVPHDEVVAWVESWDTDRELPRPEPRK